MSPKQLSLLLVEDHVILRSALAEILLHTFPNFNFYQASDGKEAIDFVKNHPCDVIIMDIQMPNMSGIEATQCIREMTLTVQPKILVLSMYAQLPIIHDAFLAGANGYALKNVDHQEMVRALTILIEDGQYIDPSIKEDYLNHALKFKNKSYPDIGLLSDREKEILRLFCLDYTNNEIAEQLNILSETVTKHKTNIKSVIKAETPAGCISFALFYGIISQEEIFKTLS